MQKADSIPSNGTAADSSTKVENLQSSSNDTKPAVVGSQCNGTSKESGIVISYFCNKENRSCLEGLSNNDKLSLMEIVQKQFNRGIKVVINYNKLSF